MTPKMSTRQRRKKSENISGKKKKDTVSRGGKKPSSIRKTKRMSDCSVTIYGRQTENKDKNIAAMSQCIL